MLNLISQQVKAKQSYQKPMGKCQIKEPEQTKCWREGKTTLLLGWFIFINILENSLELSTKAEQMNIPRSSNYSPKNIKVYMHACLRDAHMYL